MATPTSGFQYWNQQAFRLIQVKLSTIFYRFTIPTLVFLFAIGVLGIFSYTKYQQTQLIESVLVQEQRLYQEIAASKTPHGFNQYRLNLLTKSILAGNEEHLHQTFIVLAASLGFYLLIAIFIIRKLKNNSQLMGSFITQLQGMNGELQTEITTRDKMAYQLVTLNDELKFQALHDALTKLPNRRLFDDRLQSSIQSAKRKKSVFAVMLADLDGFKLINDTLGHDVGDDLLKEVALRFANAIREMDTGARLGGDEFAFILTELKSPTEASIVADRVIKALNKTITVKNHQLNINVSIGITTYPFDSDSGLILLKNADVAMYNSKNLSVGGFQFFREDMNIASKRELLLRNDFVEALQHDALHLFYQPIIDKKAHGIVHFEALLRWKHPQLGDISPLEILRLSEHLGLHLSLSEWILQQACQQLNAWRSENFIVQSLCINVTPLQLEQADYLERLKSILATHQIDANTLILEITESSLIKNTTTMTQVFNHLTDMGIKIAIDDFGTGYSSLNYLRHLPIQILKIDQSFVAALSTVPHDRNTEVTRAIIDLAKLLQLDIIAEGVETQQQADILEQLGCHKMQGYLYSRPLAAEDCLHLVVHH